MTKINNILVQNFKAVESQQIEFNGCSAIISAGNDKGKTSVLRGLIDRFRGQKPDIIVKQGESNGFNILELTDGCRVEWKFTEKTESFAYITKENIRMTQGVIKAIGTKYFGSRFDIDLFLNSRPADQTKQLQKLVGLDFDEIDLRYKEAYADRTDANKEFARVSGLGIVKPGKVEKPDIESLQKEYKEIEEQNSIIASEWRLKNQKHREDTISFNVIQRGIKEKYHSMDDHLAFLKKSRGGFFDDCIDWDKADKKLLSLKIWKDIKTVKDLDIPVYIANESIIQKIDIAGDQLKKFDSYERDLRIYTNWIEEGKKARETKDKAEEKVQKIKDEKSKMIAGANIPKDFEIVDSEIHYKGLPLNNNQVSSSSKYIAALKLGSLSLGELKTMHFDASFLDKNSLKEVQSWAEKNDYQLLIERPDYDGGEIKYEIIEK